MEDAYTHDIDIELQLPLWSRLVHSLSLMTRPSFGSVGELLRNVVVTQLCFCDLGIGVQFALVFDSC